MTLKVIRQDVLPGVGQSITTQDRGLPSIGTQGCVKVKCMNRISISHLIPEQKFKMQRRENKIKEWALDLQIVLWNSPFYGTGGLCVGWNQKDYTISWNL